MPAYRIRREKFSTAGARYGGYFLLGGLAFAWLPALATGAAMLAMAVVVSFFERS